MLGRPTDEEIGGTYLVQPQPGSEGKPGEWLKAFYDSHERLPDHFLADRDDQLPQERDWPSMSGLDVSVGCPLQRQITLAAVDRARNTSAAPVRRSIQTP